MGPKDQKVSANTSNQPEKVKGKRGRKSKKELMASLNLQQSLVNQNTNVNLNVQEINENSLDNVIVNQDNSNLDVNLIETNKVNTEVKVAKKRGRKPKGGKIVQPVLINDSQKEVKPNVILHLKCSMKDLYTENQNNNFMNSYNLLDTNNKELNYEIINTENKNTCVENTTNIDNYDINTDENYSIKESNKEIWRRLKELEHDLHINNVNNKKSACFWDTCEFDNPPIHIPKYFINGSYHVYGCFCSPECAVAYLMNESIDSSTKFERYHLLNHIYTKIYDYKKNIKPSPNPHYMLEKYYGNLSIQEYRSLLRNERLFLIVDKPLTKVLPELHEDNDEFILNNKIIPSNSYQIKPRLLKKPDKNSILNQKFGCQNQISTLE